MEQEFDLKSYLNILRRRIPHLIVPAVVVFALTCATAYLLPRLYHASAKILVESQQIPSDLARSTVTSPASERIAVIRQRLMTRSNLLQIVRDFNLFEEKQKRLSQTEIVKLMRKTAQIEQIDVGKRRRDRQAVAFTISFEYGDPQQAARVANQFVKLILEQNIRSRTNRASETHNFFEQQVEDLEKQLAVQEIAIVNFKSKNEASLPDSLAYRRALLTDLQSRIPEIDQKIQTLGAQKEFLTPSGDLELPVGVTGPIEQELAKLQLHLEQLQASYSDRHPAVKRVKSRIAALDKSLQSTRPMESSDAGTENPGEEPKDVPKVSREVAAKLAAIERQLTALMEQKSKEQERIAAIEETLTKTPQVEITLNALTREYQSFELRLSQARAKMAQAATGEQLEEDRQAERFEVIEQATAPTEPSKPDRPRIILAGLFVSVAAGIGMVLLFELLDKSIRNGRDLQKSLQIRPLSTIPFVVTSTDRHARKTKIRASLIALVVMACATGALVHVFYQPLDLVWIKLMQTSGF